MGYRGLSVKGFSGLSCKVVEEATEDWRYFFRCYKSKCIGDKSSLEAEGRSVEVGLSGEIGDGR